MRSRLGFRFDKSLVLAFSSLLPTCLRLNLCFFRSLPRSAFFIAVRSNSLHLTGPAARGEDDGGGELTKVIGEKRREEEKGAIREVTKRVESEEGKERRKN